MRRAHLPSNSNSYPSIAKPIKVLFVEYGIRFGGAVISMAELVNKLTHSGLVTATVLSALPQEIIAPLFDGARHRTFSRPINYMSRERLSMALNHPGVPRPIRWLGLKGYAALDVLAALWYALRLLVIVKKCDIDLVHINNGMERDAMYAAKWAGVPCVIHCRGLDTIDRRLVRSRAFRSVKKAIAISGAVVHLLRAHGVPEEKIELIHNPIEWEKYDCASAQRTATRVRCNFSEGDVVVAIFGRVTAWKGQLEFLRALEPIMAECPCLKIMIVGDSSDDVHGYASQVESAANAAPLLGRVTFAGYQKDVVDYYWACDIAVHNSLAAEPFGRVVAEAMACGRAVIAMNEGGPVDIIQSGHDGILIPPRQPDELARAIKGLYHSHAERERLGQNARQTVHEKFRSEIVAKRVLQLYEWALA